MPDNAVHTLTDCLLRVEARADTAGWGHPPLLLLVQDRPAPSAADPTRRRTRAVTLPLNPARLGRYRAGLADLLTDLAAALRLNRPVGRPALAACVDPRLIAGLVTEPTPGPGLLAWAVCYEDVLVDPDALHEIRRVDAVDADHRHHRITRFRAGPQPTVATDSHPDHSGQSATHAALTDLLKATTRARPATPARP
ncbi:hypothetical protein [Solwaraspora sp. WMMA2065]|uniref:hypothetical protein n=1 Tax=Solwaraspora sp. WMMA2065 TaxID=3015166 RepID=UPI00259B687D|nr:hypothetical protein [Solwaraspora sp. WMMA2065]WJK33143.1 hypothetical protein O7610_20830 [Solwaraspora sp. WMMA2065]